MSGGKLLEGEEPLSASEGDVVSLLESVLNRSGVSPQCRNYALTALMKLSARFASQADRIKVRLWRLHVRACPPPPPPPAIIHATQHAKQRSSSACRHQDDAKQIVYLMAL